MISSIRLFTRFLPVHTIVIFTFFGLLFFYILKGQRAKEMFLTFWGFVFACLYGSFKFTLLTLIITMAVYYLSEFLIVLKNQENVKKNNDMQNKYKRKIILIVGLMISLGTLLLFKYPVLKSQLPISMQVKALGISYFTFKFMHVLIDSYRGRIKELNITTFLAFIFFFPTFSAGPIDRYTRFAKDSSTRDSARLGKDSINIGVTRIIIGLFKKFIIADKTGIWISRLAPNILNTSRPILWFIVFLYSIRIYYDFSGYSDIAIGLGGLFGYKVPENFNKPYLKSNIVLFWQNWHMTLTSWLREYLFMPIGKLLIGSMGPGHTWFINSICQLITMAAVGIWHGSTYSFLIWGIYHGIGLSLYRIYSDLIKRYSTESFADFLSNSKVIRYGSIAITFIYVSIGWVFFSFKWDMAIKIICKMIR